MKKIRLLASVLCGSLTVLGFSAAASAQSMDYRSLGELFGEPVTTSATGTPRKVSEAPANMTIITAEEIRRSGSRRIPEILERVPGLNILQSGVNVFDVGVRGYQQPMQSRLLVLVDGRQVFLDDYSRTAWENIPVNVDDIFQIEVVKGASSALFGSNAVGGVINIVTHNPLYDDSNVASLSFGTQNTITGDATTTVKGPWGGSKFTIGGLTADEFDTERAPLDQPAGKPRHRYVSNATVFQVAPETHLFTEATFSDSTGNTGDPTNGSLMGEQNITTYSVRGGGHWKTPYGLISSNNYLNHSLIFIEEPTSGGAPYVYGTNLIVSQLQNQFKPAPDHAVRIGLEYRHKTFKMKGAQLLQPQSPSIDQNTYSIAGMWDWKINDKISWTNALRAGHLDMDQTGTLMPDSVYTPSDYSHSLNAISANSDIVFKATDKDTFHLGYGRGIQLPSLINSGYSLFQNFGTEADPYLSLWEGNPDLKPTIVQDYKLDYTRKLPEYFSFVKFGLYYQLNQSIVSPLSEVGTATVGGTDYPYGKSINIGNSSGYGGEIQLKGSHPSGYRWDASYSFSRVIDKTEFFIYEGSFPQHHFRLALGYTTGPWEFDGSGQYITSTSLYRSYDGGGTENVVKTKPYATLSARIGYTIDDTFTVAVSGRNLNRGTINTSPFPAIERQGFVTLTGKF